MLLFLCFSINHFCCCWNECPYHRKVSALTERSLRRRTADNQDNRRRVVQWSCTYNIARRSHCGIMAECWLLLSNKPLSTSILLVMWWVIIVSATDWPRQIDGYVWPQWNAALLQQLLLELLIATECIADIIRLSCQANKLEHFGE